MNFWLLFLSFVVQPLEPWASHILENLCLLLRHPHSTALIRNSVHSRVLWRKVPKTCLLGFKIKSIGRKDPQALVLAVATKKVPQSSRSPPKQSFLSLRKKQRSKGLAGNLSLALITRDCEGRRREEGKKF